MICTLCFRNHQVTHLLQCVCVLQITTSNTYPSTLLNRKHGLSTRILWLQELQELSSNDSSKTKSRLAEAQCRRIRRLCIWWIRRRQVWKGKWQLWRLRRQQQSWKGTAHDGGFKFFKCGEFKLSFFDWGYRAFLKKKVSTGSITITVNTVARSSSIAIALAAAAENAFRWACSSSLCLLKSNYLSFHVSF